MPIDRVARTERLLHRAERLRDWVRDARNRKEADYEGEFARLIQQEADCAPGAMWRLLKARVDAQRALDTEVGKLYREYLRLDRHRHKMETIVTHLGRVYWNVLKDEQGGYRR